MRIRTSRAEKKSEWFRRGVTALQTLLHDKPEVYGCPICLRGFSEAQIGLLTFEDSPPRSQGGREVVLTCKDCNDQAGHGIDAEAARFEKIIDFAAGTLNSPIRGYITVDEVRMDMEFTAVNREVQIAGISHTNAPGVVDALRGRLDRFVDDGVADWMFTLSFGDRSRPRPSSVSWLKSAYVIAFAAFGYRYILHPALDIVREQIRDPEREVITRFSTLAPEAKRDTRILALVEDPPELRSILVQMGRHVVFLPRPDDPDIYQRLKSAVRAAPKGTRLPWPVGPVFKLDRGPRPVSPMARIRAIHSATADVIAEDSPRNPVQASRQAVDRDPDKTRGGLDQRPRER
jgi:hypothetical protein